MTKAQILIVAATSIIAISAGVFEVQRVSQMRSKLRETEHHLQPLIEQADQFRLERDQISAKLIAAQKQIELLRHNQTSEQAGYEAATQNLEAALQQINTLPLRERKGFITGVFTYIGKHCRSAEALAIYNRQPSMVRADALRALAAEWVSNRGMLDEDTRYRLRERILAASGGKFGLEVEVAYVLGASQPDRELQTAWMDAFAQHPGRSEMLSAMAGKMGGDQVDAILERTSTWTPWEQERAARNALTKWAEEAPQEAWNYYQAHRNRFSTDFSSSIMGEWAYADPQAVKALLSTLQEPAQRQAVVMALGKALAQRNTDQAVIWANELQNEEERTTAHNSIYEATPRGIGAMIASENGYPTLKGILPGSPLESSGVQPGDRFVEVRTAGGVSHSLYGTDLVTAVNLIRGEPGTELQLRLLRQNENSGQLEEHTVSLKRDQLYFRQP